MNVEWDFDGKRSNYRYGLGSYDLIPVDEERVLRPGEMIAVGCQVRTGKGGNELTILCLSYYLCLGNN